MNKKCYYLRVLCHLGVGKCWQNFNHVTFYYRTIIISHNLLQIIMCCFVYDYLVRLATLMFTEDCLTGICCRILLLCYLSLNFLELLSNIRGIYLVLVSCYAIL